MYSFMLTSLDQHFDGESFSIIVLSFILFTLTVYDISLCEYRCHNLSILSLMDISVVASWRLS